MAKLNPLFVLLIVLGVVLVFLVIASQPNYLPYDNVKPKYAAYEPFTEANSSDKEEPKEEKKEYDSSKTNSNTLSNVTVSDKSSEKKPTDDKKDGGIGSFIKGAISGVMPASSGFSTAENFEPLMESPKTINYGQFRDSEIIDKFSQVTANGQDGVNGCVSSGLSNSGGYICLTPELIQMLKTRGGNAAGK
jgi:hypothetical protein